MNKQILLGTKNQLKIGVIQAILKPLPLEVLTLADLNINIQAREDGHSTEENAEQKARAYFAEANIPTIAFDGGLHIDKFPKEKQPGVLVRRLHGIDREATVEEMLEYYTEELEKIGGESTCAWKGSIVLVTAEEKILAESASFKAILTTKRKGDVNAGSPLDVMTIDPVTGKYYAELDWKERVGVKWVFEFVKQHLGEL
jgi:8-oxo-dGTP diphosphatase